MGALRCSARVLAVSKYTGRLKTQANNYLKKSAQPYKLYKLLSALSWVRCAAARAFWRILSSGTGSVELQVEHNSPPVSQGPLFSRPTLGFGRVVGGVLTTTLDL